MFVRGLFPLRLLHSAKAALSGLLLLCLLGGDVLGQQNPQIELQVKAVSILATVRDKRGKIVSNLTKQDFVVDEDGRPQNINYFAKENDAPLRLGLLVDTSLSQGTALEDERSASFAFLDKLLRAEKDSAFVIQFDREVELLRDFTADHAKLQSALRQLESSELASSPLTSLANVSPTSVCATASTRPLRWTSARSRAR